MQVTAEWVASIVARDGASPVPIFIDWNRLLSHKIETAHREHEARVAASQKRLAK